MMKLWVWFAFSTSYGGRLNIRREGNFIISFCLSYLFIYFFFDDNRLSRFWMLHFKMTWTHIHSLVTFFFRCIAQFNVLIQTAIAWQGEAEQGQGERKEEGRQRIFQMTLNRSRWLVPDHLALVFHNLLIYWDSHRQPAEKSKYPMSGS